MFRKMFELFSNTTEESSFSDRVDIKPIKIETQENDNKKANSGSLYSSQKVMFDVLNRNDEPGLCGPITNIFAKHQITSTTDTDILSKSNQEVYRDAVAVEKNQEKLRREGKDGKHSAFVETKTPYTVHTLKTEKIPTLKVDEILPKPGHTIITFPVDGNDNTHNDYYHQVYLGKTKAGECVSFDTERHGGEKKGNCPELLQDFVKMMSLKPDQERPPKIVTVATTSFFSGKKSDSDKQPLGSPLSPFSP